MVDGKEARLNSLFQHDAKHFLIPGLWLLTGKANHAPLLHLVDGLVHEVHDVRTGACIVRVSRSGSVAVSRRSCLRRCGGVVGGAHRAHSARVDMGRVICLVCVHGLAMPLVAARGFGEGEGLLHALSFVTKSLCLLMLFLQPALSVRRALSNFLRILVDHVPVRVQLCQELFVARVLHCLEALEVVIAQLSGLSFQGLSMRHANPFLTLDGNGIRTRPQVVQKFLRAVKASPETGSARVVTRECCLLRGPGRHVAVR
mmetsp:Transcript_46686/g.113680  ORF Transcript_46686/g.113680 Transcript_46686/m.113680 type:complete len:258 (+) Transcript_46686:288-1061(+)